MVAEPEQGAGDGAADAASELQGGCAGDGAADADIGGRASGDAVDGACADPSTTEHGAGCGPDGRAGFGTRDRNSDA